MVVMLCSVSRRVSLQKLAEMRDAVQAIVIPSSDVLSEQLQAAMVCSFTANLCG
jgi:pyrroloquinoline quinone (PQQ) biosynthesis protein C